MSIAVCILAKDEGKAIAATLEELARQTFLRAEDRSVEVHVVANGCTDDTVDKAKEMAPLFELPHTKFVVHDLHPGGKSRAWNKAVHELVSPEVTTFLFVDADISFINEGVIEGLLETLRADHGVDACSGFPIKNVSAKARKSVVDRFSLAVSAQTRHVGVVNGSLYAARADCLRDIWLPSDTPGEDGFVNAMITTRGFSRSPEPGRVVMATSPTHYFEAHGPLQFVQHERRLFVGTVINCWIFEHLWSLDLKKPAGELIDRWNREDPDWIEKIIQRRSAQGAWLIPSSLLFGRFKSASSRPTWKQVARLPIAMAATLATLPPAILANRRLKKIGAATSW